MRLPQPKYWLWMMSGAMIRSISSRVLVRSQVGITPSVSPLCGSVSISGIGMKGAFAGSNQRASLEGGGATHGPHAPCSLSRVDAPRPRAGAPHRHYKPIAGVQPDERTELTFL